MQATLPSINTNQRAIAVQPLLTPPLMLKHTLSHTQNTNGPPLVPAILLVGSHSVAQQLAVSCDCCVQSSNGSCVCVPMAPQSPAHSDVAEGGGGSDVCHIVWHREHRTETFSTAKPESSVFILMNSVICTCLHQLCRLANFHFNLLKLNTMIFFLSHNSSVLEDETF